MTVQDILNVIKTFFDSIIAIFESLGLIPKKEEETTAA